MNGSQFNLALCLISLLFHLFLCFLNLFCLYLTVDLRMTNCVSFEIDYTAIRFVILSVSVYCKSQKCLKGPYFSNLYYAFDLLSSVVEATLKL